MDHLADISPSWLQNGEVEEEHTSRYVLFPSQTILLQLQISYISDKSGEWNFLFLYPKTQSRLTSSQLCNCWDYPYAEKKTAKQTKNQNQTPHSIFSLYLFPQWLLFQICHCFISIFLSNCIVILQPKENHTSPEFCIPSEVHPSVTSFPVQNFCGFMPLFSFLNYCHFPKLLLLPQSACTVGKCCRDMKPLLPLNLLHFTYDEKGEQEKKNTTQL